MFGRRFYDPNEDGNTGDGLLQLAASARDHALLLSDIRPLLANADLTVLNLESPLVDQPYSTPTLPRPSGFHPTKEFAFASLPSVAEALRSSGVDIVGLGNNHLYDALEGGVQQTIQSLEKAGYRKGQGYVGAGMNAKEAWTPAIVEVKGIRIAFVAGTTISGHEHPVSYVASDNKAGAAEVSESRLRQAIAAARKQADVVVTMIHGGYEYGRDPSPQVRSLSLTAVDAGSNLVVNHHPHVVGGFSQRKGALIAWSLGNFLFDQTVWPTFESYLLAVQLRNGKIVRAYVEPMIIQNYTPTGITGAHADYVAQGAAGRGDRYLPIESGSVEAVDLPGTRPIFKDLVLDGGAEGRIFRIVPGWNVDRAEGNVQVGRDLLWTGDFEDRMVGRDVRPAAPLWNFYGYDKRVSSRSAYEGKAGARLQRNSSSELDAVMSPLHRFLLSPGTGYTVFGMYRTSTQPNAGIDSRPTVQISWYSDTKGGSGGRKLERLPLTAKWTPFRKDLDRPLQAVAAGLFFRLGKGPIGQSWADFDNVRVIEWLGFAGSQPREADHLLVRGKARVRMSRLVLPGGAEDPRQPLVSVP